MDRTLKLAFAATAALMATAGPASACRSFQSPSLSESERERRADETLVRRSDAILLAEVSGWRSVGPDTAPIPTFRPLSALTGQWPERIGTESTLLILDCQVVGNKGQYPGAKEGDRAILFIIDDAIFDAEPLGTRRAARLRLLVEEGSR